MRASDTVLLNSRTTRPLHVSRMGFGGAAIGNLYREIQDWVAQETLTKAYDLGLRYFDTAPQYGLGLSEQRFGIALKQFDRSAIHLATKVGRLLVDCEPHEVTPEAFVNVPQKKIVFDYSYDGVMKSYEESKIRMGESNIEILLVHDVCAVSQGSQEASDARVKELFEDGGYRALMELRDAGEIIAIGAGVNEWEVCEKLLQYGDFDCFLLAGRYTLLEQSALETFLPLCLQRDVGVILGGPYNSGILATGAVPGAKYNYSVAPEEIMSRVRQIESICEIHGIPLIAAALQFVLGHPSVKSVVPGAANVNELQSNVDILETPIPPEFWSQLKKEGYLRSDAPCP